MAIRYIQPGKPNQNAYIERFNRTFRDEVLDQHLFVRLDDLREAAYWWMIEYNEQRPHDSLGEMTHVEYRQHVAGSSISVVSATGEITFRPSPQASRSTSACTD